MQLPTVVLCCGLIAFFAPCLRGEFLQTPSGNGAFGAPPEAEKTIIGCILQRNGRFLLVNSKRSEGLEIRMAADIRSAVGLQAKVKGIFEYPSTMNRSTKKANFTTASSKRIPIAMEVSSMTFMSGTCDKDGMVRK